MTTNLLLTLTWIISTNWSEPQTQYLLSHPMQLQYSQSATITSNLVAVVEWHGRGIVVPLERYQIGTTNRIGRDQRVYE